MARPRMTLLYGLPASLSSLLLVLVFAAAASAHDFGENTMAGNRTPDPAEDCECDEEGRPPEDEGEPVSPFTGKWFYRHVDLEVPGVFPIVMVRRYDSQTTYQSPLGAGWAFTHDVRLFEYPDGSVVVRSSAGLRHRYTDTDPGPGVSFDLDAPTPGWRHPLKPHPTAPGEYILTDPQGTERYFDTEGRMTRIRNPQGNELVFSYSASKEALTGTSLYSVDPDAPLTVAETYRLERIDEAVGGCVPANVTPQTSDDCRHVVFAYHASGSLQSITSHDGRSVSYVQDAGGNLTSVTLPTGIVQTFGYGDGLPPGDPGHDPKHNHLVTFFRDGQGMRAIRNDYDAQGRVIEQKLEGAPTELTLYEFNYAPADTDLNHVDDFELDSDPQQDCSTLTCTLVTHHVYDDQEQLIHSGKTLYKFTTGGFPLDVIDALGHQRLHVYEAGRPFLESFELWRNDGTPIAPSRTLQQRVELDFDAAGDVTERRTPLEPTNPSSITITESLTYDHGWIASQQTTSDAPGAPVFRTEFIFERQGLAEGEPGYDASAPPSNIETIRRKIDAGFEVTRFDYDAEGKLIEITPPAVSPDDQLRIVHTYYDRGLGENDHGLLKQIHLEANGGPIPELGRSFSYEPFPAGPVGSGFVQTVTDAKGHVTTLAWDALNRLVQVQNPAAGGVESTLFTYGAPNAPPANPMNTDPGRHLTRIERGQTAAEGEGQVQRLLWNDRGHLAAFERKDDVAVFQPFFTFFPDTDGNRLRSLDGKGQLQTFQYDVLGRLIALSDHVALWDGVSAVPAVRSNIAFIYDAVGNRIQSKDSKDRETEFVYDALDRLTDVIQQGNGDPPNLPAPLTTHFEYDPAGNVILVRDPELHDTVYAYDDLSRLTSVTQHLGQQVVYGYDGRGRLETVTNARSQVLRYAYEPWGGLEQLDHDLDGNPATIDRSIVHTYDASGNLRAVVDDALLTGVAADAGAPAELPADRLYSFAYDPQNRVDAVTAHYIPNAGDLVLDASYDRFGNRDGLALDPAGENLVHEWVYNKLNRLIEATLPPDPTTGPATLQLSYLGNDDLDLLTHGNGLVTDHDYHPYGPLASVTLGPSTNPAHRLAYTVDEVLNIEAIQETVSGAVQMPDYGFDYDAVYRLTDADYPMMLGLPTAEDWAYDGAGNRDEADPATGSPLGTSTYDDNNRITASPGLSYSFDADGNLGTRTEGATVWDFRFDATNRLTKIEEGPTPVAEYLYDPFGRRIRKIDPTNGTTYFLWDGDQLLAEYDGTSGNRELRYAYTGGFAPVQVAYSPTPGTEVVYEVHTDHLDTPRVLTDASQLVVWRASYRAFGQASLNVDAIPFDFNLRFPGQYHDAETRRLDMMGQPIPGSGLHYNRFRYYDPNTGRYVSADPIGQGGGGNVHQYARNNPTRFIDRLGLQATEFPGGLDDPELERILKENSPEESAPPAPPESPREEPPPISVDEIIEGQEKLKEKIGPTVNTCLDSKSLCLEKATGVAECPPGEDPPTLGECERDFLECYQDALERTPF